MTASTYQIGSPDGRRQFLVGRDEVVLAHFTPPGMLDLLRGVMLQAEIERQPVGLMRPAPWNGKLWRVLVRGHDLATADNPRVGPLSRRERGSFDISWNGSPLQLLPDDPRGFAFRLLRQETEVGNLQLRDFERGARWYANLEVPGELPLALVAFIAWLAREGRADLERARGN